jgi:hypothetical protein
MQMKTTIKKILSTIGLLPAAQKIAAIFRTPPQHGHDTLLNYLKANDLDCTGRTIIEIGSTREALNGQGSTSVLGEYCKKNGSHFITVDMDPEQTQRAQVDLNKIDTSFQSICSKGEDFLSSTESDIDIVYLDAFDFNHDHHSDQRRDKYKNILGTDINDEDCWSMHLACAEAIISKATKSAIIAFDDTWNDDGGWQGKGKLAIPLLLENSFKLTSMTGMTALLTRE